MMRINEAFRALSGKTHRLFVWIAAAAILATSSWAADEVRMKNGDRVTGEIIKKDGDTLTIKSVHFGTVTLPWAEIESVKAEQTLNVQLEGGDTVQATISGTDSGLQVAAPSQTLSVAPAAVVAIRNADEQAKYERFLNPGLFDLWTVSGSLNIAGAKGNAETFTFTTPFTFARVSNTSKTTAYFNAIRASARIEDVSEETAQAIRGGWGYSRNVSSKMFLNTFNDYEYDKFQSLDLRVVFGGGAGYHAWKGERGFLDFQGGGAWNREKFDPAPEPSFVRNSAEAYWGNDFQFKLTSRTAITQGFRMFNNLSETGDYRMNFDAGATTQLTSWLTWNIALSDRYLSNPVPGRQANDILYTTGLGFTFSR
jgi:putative salt-induced outer membrane protein